MTNVRWRRREYMLMFNSHLSERAKVITRTPIFPSRYSRFVNWISKLAASSARHTRTAVNNSCKCTFQAVEIVSFLLFKSECILESDRKIRCDSLLSRRLSHDMHAITFYQRKCWLFFVPRWIDHTRYTRLQLTCFPAILFSRRVFPRRRRRPFRRRCRNLIAKMFYETRKETVERMGNSMKFVDERTRELINLRQAARLWDRCKYFTTESYIGAGYVRPIRVRVSRKLRARNPFLPLSFSRRGAPRAALHLQIFTFT